jgi:AcrR family transcriptional regulator
MGKSEKPITNRDKILEAALVAFIEAGIHQTGMRDIAKRAGVSLGNLYNHFAGKQALIVEIARIEAEEIEALLAGLPEGATAIEGICALAMAVLTLEARQENAVLTAELTVEAIRNPDVAKMFAANEKRLLKTLKRMLTAGVAKGEIKLPNGAMACAQLIIDTARAAGFRTAFEGKSAVAEAKAVQNIMIRKLLMADHSAL